MSQEHLIFADEPTLDGVEPPTMSQAESNLCFEVQQRVRSGFRGLGVYDEDPKEPEPYYEFKIKIPLPENECVFVVSDAYPHRYSDGIEVLNEYLKNWQRDPNYEKVKAWISQNVKDLEHARRWYMVKRQEKLMHDIEIKVKELQEQHRHLARVRNVAIVQVREGRWLQKEEKRALMLDFGASLDEIRW